MLEKKVGPREDCLCLFSVREVTVSSDCGGTSDDRGKREEELEWSCGKRRRGPQAMARVVCPPKVTQRSRAGEWGNEVEGAFGNSRMPASSFLSHLGGKVIWQVSEERNTRNWRGVRTRSLRCGGRLGQQNALSSGSVEDPLEARGCRGSFYPFVVAVGHDTPELWQPCFLNKEGVGLL